MQEDETGLPSPSDAHTLMLWLSRTWALSPFSVPRDLPSVRPGTLLLSPETLAAPPDLVSLILPSVLLTALALNPNSASVKCIWIKVLPFPTRSEAEHHTLLKSTCPCTRGAREHPGFKRILEVVPCEGLHMPAPLTSSVNVSDSQGRIQGFFLQHQAPLRSVRRTLEIMPYVTVNSNCLFLSSSDYEIIEGRDKVMFIIVLPAS